MVSDSICRESYKSEFKDVMNDCCACHSLRLAEISPVMLLFLVQVQDF